MDAETYAMHAHLMLRNYDDSRPRSKQTQAHRLGVSDVGSCENYAVLLTRETPFTDSPPRGQAIMGTFIHEGLAKAKAHANPSLILDAEVTITMPNGVVLEGHPDEIDPEENSVTDDKTVDGVALMRRTGPTEQQQYQVGLYALGCVQQGLLDGSKPLTVRLAYWDRLGKDDTPHVWQHTLASEQELIAWLAPATLWIENVIYAVQHGEEGSRDKSVDWCAAACRYYSVCRLPNLPEVDELITEPEVVAAAKAYKDGHALEKEGAALKRSSKAVLDGRSGIIPVDADHRLRLRWVSVPASSVKATERQAYKRMSLMEV
jgi:hypothetical protein